MKKIFSILSVLAVVLSSLSPLYPVYAEGMTDSWLSGWDYEIKDLYNDGAYIWLNRYTGTDPDVTIHGKAAVDGIRYPVCINVTYADDNSPYITGLNCGDNIVNLTFESADGTPVRSSRPDRLDDMFYGMENLETVAFGGNFRGNVAQAIDMFNGCVNLKSVDIENLDFGHATVYQNMFKNCRSLKRITISCPNGTNLSGMFSGCTSLEEAVLKGAARSAMTVSGMFSECRSLKRVDLSGMDFSEAFGFAAMFSNCQSLEAVDMSVFDFSYALTLDDMFSGCSSLKSIDLSAAEWGDDTVSAKQMFCGCGNLEEITLSEGFRPRDASDIFYVPTPSMLKVKGNVSNEFRENALQQFESQNRYLGSIKLISKIELEGKELEDNMFSISREANDGSGRRELFNQNQHGNIVEHQVFIHTPGMHTFEVEERYVSEKVGGVPVKTIAISETPEYSCEDVIRSKTVNIVLNTDGSLSAEE